jgi:hypothetical protein
LRKKARGWSKNVEADIKKKRKNELNKEYDKLDILAQARPLTT